MATTGHVKLGSRGYGTCVRHYGSLSQEEIALLHVLRSSGGHLKAEDAASRTGMDAGLARLGLALLEDRGLLAS